MKLGDFYFVTGQITRPKITSAGHYALRGDFLADAGNGTVKLINRNCDSVEQESGIKKMAATRPFQIS